MSTAASTEKKPFNLTAFLTRNETIAAKLTDTEGKLAAATASLATVTAERDAATAKLAAVPTGDATLLAAAQADLATAKASLASTNAACDEKISAICGALCIPVADAADSAKIQSALAAKVAARSTAQLAELGFDASKLPAPVPAEADKAKSLTRAEFSALPAAGQLAFVRAGGKVTDPAQN